MKPEDARFQLEMIRPYFNHLRRTVMQDERLKRRQEQHGVYKIESGVIFQAPIFQQWVEESKKPKIDQIREELRLIAESAKYDGAGTQI